MLKDHTLLVYEYQFITHPLSPQSELGWSTKQQEEHEEEELRSLAAGAELAKLKVTVETVPQAGEMAQPLVLLHSYHTWACGVSTVWRLVPFAALSDCLRLRTCCCCGGCLRCCPPCADCRGRFPLHVFCPQLLCQLLQDFPPGSPAAGALWIRCGHWSQPGRGCYRSPLLAVFAITFDGVRPRHLVRDVHTVLGVVVVHDRLWFCLRLTKGAHTCVHGAQDADILPRLSLVHSQSRITTLQCWTARPAVSQRDFCLPMVSTRLYNTTIL